MLRRFACTMLVLCIMAGLFSVTALGAEEKGKTVRVGYYNDSQGFQYGSGDEERKSGYAYEYYQEIAKYTGWVYEYEYGSWEEIYEKLLNGEVDIMAGISNTGSRPQEMLFSRVPMGEETYCIYTLEDNNEISAQDAASLEGARIGVKDNSYMKELLEKFLADHGVTCEIIAYSGLEERLADLDRGRIDCIVTVESDVLQGLKAMFEIGSADFYFAVNKERGDLLEELNAAQVKILCDSPYYISRLQDKYFNGSLIQPKLTDEEKEWLAGNPALKVGYLTDYMPFCDRRRDGELDGMLKVILAELSEYMGTQFIVTGYDDYGEMIRALEEGDLNMVFPTFGDLWYSEKQNYIQTLFVASARMCVVYKGNYRNDIYDRIAVSEGSPLQPFYLTINYPEAEQIFYKGWEECLRAVQDGDAGCMLINSDLIYRYLNAHSEFNRLNVAELEDTVNFCFAVKRGEIILYSILNKGLSSLDETVVSDALIRNSYVEPDYTVRDFLVSHIGLVLALAAGFILLLILFFILYRNRVLREKRVQQEAYEREKEYIADKERKFNIIASLSRIYVCTYYVNLVEKSYQKISNLDFKRGNRKLAEQVRDALAWHISRDVEESYQEELIHFLDLDTLEERMGTGDILSIEYETRQLGWCRGSFITAKRGADGRLLCVIYAIQEVNEEKKAQHRAQKALQEAYEAANNANQAKSSFLSRMSHDIRTPMNAIIGMTLIAENHIDDKERVSDCLKKITASGRHLLTLINEVLDMSKIESGKLQPQEEEFNLQELVDNLLTMVRPQAEAKKQDLRVSIRDVKHERVIGDCMHLQQVFVNILGNAVKYTQAGGCISLSIEEKATDMRHIACYEFAFEDNGIGMSREFMNHIFEPFSRENEARSNCVQGTGLGLAIALNIARMMGGDIKVESEQGRGSKFTVTAYLQILEDAEASCDKIAGLQAPDDDKASCEGICMMGKMEFSGKKALLTEDNELNAEIAREILESMGLSVVNAWDGREALEILQASEPGQFDVIFMDIQMPVMNGYEAARAIRSLGREDLRKLPIIAMTADAFAEDVQTALQAGMNQHIAKPIELRQLTEALHKWVGAGG